MKKISHANNHYLSRLLPWIYFLIKILPFDFTCPDFLGLTWKELHLSSYTPKYDIMQLRTKVSVMECLGPDFAV